MNDLTERLRTSDGYRAFTAGDGHRAFTADTDLMVEAADRIEQLEAENSELKMHCGAQVSLLASYVEALKAFKQSHTLEGVCGCDHCMAVFDARNATAKDQAQP